MSDQGGYGYGGPEPDPAQDPVTIPGMPVVPPEELTAPIPLAHDAVPPAPPPARPRGSHRATPPPGARSHHLMRNLTIGGLVAVAVVVGLYAFASCVRTDDVTVPITPTVSDTPAPTGSVATGTPSPSASPGSTATDPADEEAPAAKPGRSEQAEPKATNKSSKKAESTKKAEPTKKAETKPKQAARMPVVVLNSTSVVGLAARVATDVRAVGWEVPETANWRGGGVTETTVYYRPGAKNKAAAQRLAKEFDLVAGVARALPGMDSPLVLVLAADAA